MNTKEFSEMVRSGVYPVITFRKGIEDSEGYAEAGMRAKVISAVIKHDDCVLITVDFSQFDEFNKSYESSNYYDKNGNAVWTARQAEQYKVVDSWYLDASTEFSHYAEVTNSDSLKLFQEFSESNTDKTYVEWLEAKVVTK